MLVLDNDDDDNLKEESELSTEQLQEWRLQLSLHLGFEQVHPDALGLYFCPETTTDED